MVVARSNRSRVVDVAAALVTQRGRCATLMQMGIVSTLHATVIDKFQSQFPAGRRRILLLLAICVVQFLLALTLCTNVSSIKI